MTRYIVDIKNKHVIKVAKLLRMGKNKDQASVKVLKVTPNSGYFKVNGVYTIVIGNYKIVNSLDEVMVELL